MNIRPEPGTPVTGIPLCVPEICGNEWQYIKECLDTNWVSSVGEYVDKFEQMVADFVGVDYAVAVVNGTAALHLSLIVAGIGADNEVIMPSLTFIAPANAVRYVGAYPVFLDSEPDYWQLDCNKLESFFKEGCSCKSGKLINKVTQREIKAILPVHILGHPCNMDKIMQLADNYGLVVIEDATESLGASYKGRKTGAIGNIACFSFNGNKIITTGGGGMLVTNNAEWAQKAKFLSTQAKDDSLEYIHSQIGYNYRLTNIQSAMGCAQMELLPDYITKKKNIAKYYKEAFTELKGISCMNQADWADSIFWLFTILVDEKNYGINSRALLKKLEENKIQTRPLWQPLHLSKVFEGSISWECEVAEKLNCNALSIPCSVGLTGKQQEYVIEKISKPFS